MAQTLVNNQKLCLIKNRKGLSLLEVCVTVCVVGILAGVGAVQYGKVMNKAGLRDLHDSARLFATAVNICVQSSRGWNIPLLKSDGDICDGDPCSIAGHKHFPCKVEGNSDDDTKFKNLQKDLKGTLNYECPITKQTDNNKCKTAIGDKDSSEDDNLVFCLSIKKQISGDNYQIVVIIDTENTNKSKVYCSKTPTDLTDSNCKIQDSSNTTFSAWNAGNTNKQCEWPQESKTSS